MDDSLLVRRFERLRDLLRDRQCLVDGNRSRAQCAGQAFAVDKFEDEKMLATASSRP